MGDTRNGRSGSGDETAQTRARRGVADVLLATPTGERMPNVDEMRSSIGVGVGTIQKALNDLRDRGRVEFESRPRYGTVVLSKEIGPLWTDSGRPALSVLLPLPNSWEFQGLATGLRSEFDRLEIPSIFLYAHGSKERVEALRTRLAHIAVMSLGAARRQTEDDLIIHSGLPVNSYYAAKSVLVIARAPRAFLPEPLRIGIDRHSPDHAWLTEAEFPGGKYVDVSYAQMPSALSHEAIDAAVWHRTALGLSLDDQGLIAWPLEKPEAKRLSETLSSAAFVICDGDAATAGVLDSVRTEQILRLQQGVVGGDVLPLY